MFGNIGKVFARTGRDIHIRELRAGVLPQGVVLVTGFLAGYALTLIPWALLVITNVLFIWLRGWFIENGGVFDGAAFGQYAAETWQYGALIGGLGVVLAGLRRYSARHNRYVTFGIGSDGEFRFGYDEVAAVVGLTTILFVLSETAWYFSVFTVFASVLIGIVWREIDDFFLKVYAVVRRDHGPESVFGVWEIARRHEAARDARVRGVGVRRGGRTVIITGLVPPGPALELFEKLPELVVGVEDVLINPADLQVNDEVHPYYREGRTAEG